MRFVILPLLSFAVVVASTFASAAESFSGSTEAVLAAAPELSRKTVDLGTHTATYIRIAPPALPTLPADVALPAAAAPSAEEAAAEAARAAKTQVELSPSCTVYVNVGHPTITELIWWSEGRRRRAWSNVNFLHLTRSKALETSTHVVWWAPMVSESSVEGISTAELPAGFSLFTSADTAPVYFFEGDESDMATEADTLFALDLLHAYYELHRERLAAEHAQIAAEAAARAAELESNPPIPPDTVIHFWRAPAPAPAATP
jgi:hypothetical protein